MPKVVITQGPGAGKTFEFDTAVILGRLDTNDIPVKDKKASREHAKIYRQGRQFAIVDLNSSNGTFVNEEKITKRILEAGDEIGIGLVRMRFEAPEVAKEPAPAARKSLEKAFEDAPKPTEPAAPAAASGTPEITLRGFQPKQYSRVRAGKTLLGFDFDQLSGTGRLIVYVVLICVFLALMYVAYAAVVGTGG